MSSRKAKAFERAAADMPCGKLARCYGSLIPAGTPRAPWSLAIELEKFDTLGKAVVVAIGEWCDFDGIM